MFRAMGKIVTYDDGLKCRHGVRIRVVLEVVVVSVSEI
jgi:hypothetical protein